MLFKKDTERWLEEHDLELGTEVQFYYGGLKRGEVVDYEYYAAGLYLSIKEHELGFVHEVKVDEVW